VGASSGKKNYLSLKKNPKIFFIFFKTRAKFFLYFLPFFSKKPPGKPKKLFCQKKKKPFQTFFGGIEKFGVGFKLWGAKKLLMGSGKKKGAYFIF